MASVETMFVINFILNIIIAVTGIIIAMLIPSTKKIREGEAGTSMGAKWIPVVLVLMVIVAISVLPMTVAFLEDRDMIFGVILDLIAIAVTVMAVREYISARKAYKEMFQDHEVVELAAMQQPQPQQHQVPQQTPQHETVTVECPGCGNHLHIDAGSHSITCPYCGISGSI